MARIIETEPPKDGKGIFAQDDYRYYAGRYRCQGCGALVEMDASDVLRLVDPWERNVNRDGKRTLWIQTHWNGELGETSARVGGTPCCEGSAFFIEA